MFNATYFINGNDSVGLLYFKNSLFTLLISSASQDVTCHFISFHISFHDALSHAALLPAPNKTTNRTFQKRTEDNPFEINLKSSLFILIQVGEEAHEMDDRMQSRKIVISLPDIRRRNDQSWGSDLLFPRPTRGRRSLDRFTFPLKIAKSSEASTGRRDASFSST